MHTACLSRAIEAGWPALPRALRHQPGFWWLDSALAPRRGRFSYAGIEPAAVVRARGTRVEIDAVRGWGALRDGGHEVRDGPPLDVLRSLLPPRLRPDPLPGIPFVGGAVGVFSYELATRWLPFEPSPGEGLDLPDLAFLLVDQVLAFDHLEGRLEAIAVAWDDDEHVARRRATERLEAFVDRVAAAPEPEPARASFPPRLIADAAMPADLRSELDEAAHAKAVLRVKELIAAGEVYQACLTYGIDVPWQGDPHSLYDAIRELDPAPFGAWLSLPEATLLSSSPECFLGLGRDRWVESRPIKGTRPRSADPERDRALQRELAASEKDRAENLMIVDLVRNDLGRVCEVGSVHVPELMVIEPYAGVFQMVSTVRGRLRRSCDVFDLVRAAFPPGSMTGAPKLAAMRILSGLEPGRRGIYSGALGFLDLRGGASLAVVIRTALHQSGRVRIHVGGGIVADSEPDAEWRESLDKARALLAALAASAVDR